MIPFNEYIYIYSFQFSQDGSIVFLYKLYLYFPIPSSFLYRSIESNINLDDILINYLQHVFFLLLLHSSSYFNSSSNSNSTTTDNSRGLALFEIIKKIKIVKIKK